MRIVSAAVLGLLVQASAQAPYVPTEVLSRAQDIRDAGHRVAAQLWPGWDPGATPLGIYQQGQYLAVLGAKEMPAPFKMDPASSAADPLFVAPTSGFPGVHFVNAVAIIAGQHVALISADDLMSKASTEDAAAYGIGQLFRSYEQQIAPKKHADYLVLLWGRYPDFATRNRVLMQMEADSLLDAIHASDDEQCTKHVAEFLGARAERRKDLAADVIAFESGEEASDGLAGYVEYRLLEAAFSAKPDLREQRIAGLAKIRELPREREQERFVLLGMAEALLLDRLRPTWKKEFESSDAMLDELLGRVTKPSPELRAWGQALPEEQTKVRKWEDEGSRRIGLMMAQKARKVVIEVAGAKSKLQLRALNPSMMVPLTPNDTAFTYLGVDFDDIKMDFAGVPVVYEKQQDAFWCMLPEDVVDKAIADMGDKLKIEGRGFSLQFENFEISQRGKEIRIHPARILEKKGAVKPESVKPKPN
jgi:hypothetical protein